MTRPDRGSMWQSLGAPDEQIGSVNDPRTHEDAGVRWNEKWIYLGLDGAPAQVVFWHRYDLAGVFRVCSDGSLEALLEPAGA